MFDYSLAVPHWAMWLVVVLWLLFSVFALIARWNWILQIVGPIISLFGILVSVSTLGQIERIRQLYDLQLDALDQQIFLLQVVSLDIGRIRSETTVIEVLLELGRYENKLGDAWGSSVLKKSLETMLEENNKSVATFDGSNKVMLEELDSRRSEIGIKRESELEKANVVNDFSVALAAIGVIQQLLAGFLVYRRRHTEGV
jgi:hypothetical protein